MTKIEQTNLYKKVYGCMLGGAIGDALGGPVEHWTPEEIRETYGGNLDRFVPYRRAPSYHGHFGEGDSIGVYTDDTRLKHLLCQAIINADGMPRPGDMGHVLARAYHDAPDKLHEGFLEEYYLKAVWGRDKVIFGGEPTNGAIMCNSPIGFMAACRPNAAYQAGFDLAFFTDGHAKTGAALLVSAIAEAMRPKATVEGIIEAALNAHLNFARRREGDLWTNSEMRYDPNLKFLTKSLEIARREKDVFAIRQPLYDLLEWGHLFSESIHTVCVALAMFVAAEGDLVQTIVGGVMYGRDKDSYASVGGALAGAFNGIDAIPKKWIEPVIAANPNVDMQALSVKLAEIIFKKHSEEKTAVNELDQLLISNMTSN